MDNAHKSHLSRINAVKKTPRHTANLQGRERQQGRVTKNLGLFQHEEGDVFLCSPARFSVLGATHLLGFSIGFAPVWQNHNEAETDRHGSKHAPHSLTILPN